MKVFQYHGVQMMNNNEIEEIALTNEIICRLIYEFNLSSLVKILFVTLSVKNMQIYFSPSSKKYGLINEIYDAVSLGFKNGFCDFKYIFNCLEILEKNNYIIVHDKSIQILKTANFSKTNTILNSKVFKKMILDVTKLSDLSFIKGVIENV